MKVEDFLAELPYVEYDESGLPKSDTDAGDIRKLRLEIKCKRDDLQRAYEVVDVSYDYENEVCWINIIPD